MHCNQAYSAVVLTTVTKKKLFSIIWYLEDSAKSQIIYFLVIPTLILLLELNRHYAWCSNNCIMPKL